MAEAWDSTSLSSCFAYRVLHKKNAKYKAKSVKEKGTLCTFSVVAF